MALFQRLMNYLGYVPKPTIFNDVQDDSKKVINEAKVEEVQSTLMVKPKNLYSLKFYPQKHNRFSVHSDREYLCSCYINQMQDIENDFNNYKMGGYSDSEIKEELKRKYNIPHSEAGRRGGKKSRRGVSKNKRNYSTNEYSFVKHRNRLIFSYRFDGALERVCYCANGEKEKALSDVRELLKEGYTKEQVKFLLKRKYNRRQTNG